MGSPKHILKSLDNGSIRLLNENFRKVTDELELNNFLNNQIKDGNVTINKTYVQAPLISLDGSELDGAHINPLSITAEKIAAGAITADKISVTDLSAVAAQIGGWKLTADSLMDTSEFVGMSSAITTGDDIRFWAGSSDKSNAPFKVTEAGKLYAKDIITAGRELVVEPGESIQAAINELESTGGRVILSNGLHTVTGDIYLKSGVYFSGETMEGTILDFGGTFNMYAVGTNAYQAGTISVTQGSTTVTGSGTTWLTNIAAGQNIKLGNSWCLVTVVVSDTELTIEMPYSGSDIVNGFYVAATTLDDCEINNATIVNLKDRLLLQYAKNYLSDAILIANSGGSGLSVLDGANMTFEQVNVALSASSPTISNVGLTEFKTLGLMYSGGNGISCDKLSDCLFSSVYCYGNTSNGLHFNNIFGVTFSGTVYGNGLNGISINNSANLIINSFGSYSNYGNGIDISTSNSVAISGGAIFGNGENGVKISSTSYDTIVSGCILRNNGISDILDYGIDTVIDNNVGDGLPFKQGDETWQLYWDGTYAGIKGNIVCNTPLLLAGYTNANLPIPPTTSSFNNPGATT